MYKKFIIECIKVIFWIFIVAMIFWIPEFGVLVFIGIIVKWLVKWLWNKPIITFTIKKRKK